MSPSGTSGDIYTETLAVFDKSEDPSAPLTTPEVADSLDVARRTVYKRLEKLVDRGDLKTKKAGANARVWWRPVGWGNERPPSREEEQHAQAGQPPQESEERYRTLAEEMSEGFALCEVVRDADGQVCDIIYIELNEAFEELTGVSRLDAEGRRASDVFPERNDSVLEQYGRVAETGEPEHYESYAPANDRWYDVRMFPRNKNLVAVLYDDITERKQHERQLEQYKRIVETVGDGIFTVDATNEFSMVNEAYADMLGYTRDELIGTHASRVASVEDYTAGEGLKAELDTASDVAQHELELETKNGEIVPVEVRFSLFPSPEGEEFGVVAVVRDITEHKQHEEELAALNRLNQVFQEITYAVIESSSREEIERTITEQLTSSDSYEYAWIGHLNRHGESVIPQTGETDAASLSEIALSTETGDSTSYRTVVEATRTRAVQVTYDSPADPVFEQWTRSAESDHKAMASIPITFEETVYGVLTVYTGRENAFDENERRLIERLGEVVGHAINSVDRKRALLEDRITEVTFRSEEIAEILIDAIGHSSFTFSVDESIVLPGDQTLTYYAVDGIDPDVFIGIFENLYPDSECAVVAQTGSTSRVEVKTAEATGVSELAKYNSWVVDSRFENGEFRVTVGVPQTTDVRNVIALIKDFYPGTRLIARTDIEREKPHLVGIFSDLNDQLTDRQRTALEVAYYAGYFDWPRAITGKELAERLDVTQGTASHHIRHGEHKLLSAFFNATA